MTVDERAVGPAAEGTGRRILLLVGASVVAVAGLIGFFVGTNNEVATFDAFGVVTLPGSGLAVAAYGVVLSGLALAVLFGLVELASRLEGA